MGSSLSTPLNDDQYGYVFTFDVPAGAENYAKTVKEAFLKTISYFDFSGRCEMYEEDGFLAGEHFFWIALGLKFPRIIKPTPKYDWWMKFYERVTEVVENSTPLKISDSCSEMARMAGIRRDKRPCGAYEFQEGKNIRFIEPDEHQRQLDPLDALSP